MRNVVATIMWLVTARAAWWLLGAAALLVVVLLLVRDPLTHQDCWERGMVSNQSSMYGTIWCSSRAEYDREARERTRAMEEEIEKMLAREGGADEEG
jgi:hypothetical protein